jgi:hypothetical protein
MRVQWAQQHHTHTHTRNTRRQQLARGGLVWYLLYAYALQHATSARTRPAGRFRVRACRHAQLASAHGWPWALGRRRHRHDRSSLVRADRTRPWPRGLTFTLRARAYSWHQLGRTYTRAADDTEREREPDGRPAGGVRCEEAERHTERCGLCPLIDDLMLGCSDRPSTGPIAN